MSVNEKMTAIADAIRAKTGGTEPLGLDAMAAAIAALETGGGTELPSFLSEISFGKFSYTSAVDDPSVEHGLSGTPTGFIVWREAQSSNPGTAYITAAYGHSYKFYNTSTGGSFWGTTLVLNGSTAMQTTIYTADTTTFTVDSGSYSAKTQPSAVYYWIAWR